MVSHFSVPRLRPATNSATSHGTGRNRTKDHDRRAEPRWHEHQQAPDDVIPTWSLVEPHLLHAAPVVERVVGHEVLDVRPLSEIFDAPAQHWSRDICLELLLDVPYQLEPPGRVQLGGLAVDHLIHLL